jgi:hypothetical protein
MRAMFWRWLARQLSPYLIAHRKAEAAQLISLVQKYKPKDE